jgi:hypothetical protein
MEARLHHPRAEGAQGPGLNANGQACFSARPSCTFFTDFEIGAPLVILITTAAKRPFAFEGKRSRVVDVAPSPVQRVDGSGHFRSQVAAVRRNSVGRDRPRQALEAAGRGANALSAKRRAGVIGRRVVDPAVQRSVVPGEDGRARRFAADPPCRVAEDLLAVPRDRLDPRGTSVAHVRSLAVEGDRPSVGLRHGSSVDDRPRMLAFCPSPNRRP